MPCIAIFPNGVQPDKIILFRCADISLIFPCVGFFSHKTPFPIIYLIKDMLLKNN